MQFLRKKSVQKNQLNGVSEQATSGTSPSAAVLDGTLHLFYTGSGGKSDKGEYYDAIWWTSIQKDETWAIDKSIRDASVKITTSDPIVGLKPDHNPGMTVSPGTSASAVVFNNRLYLFYVGSGNNGIWHIELNRDTGSQEVGQRAPESAKWLAAQSVDAAIDPLIYSNIAGYSGNQVRDPSILTRNITPGTSPNVVEFKGSLYLFYSGPETSTQSQDTNIYFTRRSRVGNWEPVRPIKTPDGLPRGANPSAVVFRDTLYLFYVHQGDLRPIGGYGFSTSTQNGDDWTPHRQVPSSPIERKTSPCAIVISDVLHVFYKYHIGDEDYTGMVVYTKSNDSETWASTMVQLSTRAGRGQDDTVEIAKGTSPCLIEYRGLVFAIWNSANGTEATTYFAQSPVEIATTPIPMGENSSSDATLASPSDGKVNSLWVWTSNSIDNTVSGNKGIPQQAGELRLDFLGLKNDFIFAAAPLRGSSIKFMAITIGLADKANRSFEKHQLVDNSKGVKLKSPDGMNDFDVDVKIEDQKIILAIGTAEMNKEAIKNCHLCVILEAEVTIGTQNYPCKSPDPQVVVGPPTQSAG